MKRCISCQALNNDTNHACQKCGCTLFEGAFSNNYKSTNNSTRTPTNFATVMQTTAILIFIIGFISVTFLLYQFTRPFISKGHLNFIEFLIVAAVGFYHFVIGIICLGIKEILTSLKKNNVHPTASTKSSSSLSKMGVKADKPKTYNRNRVPSSNDDKNKALSKQNTQFVFETVRQLDNLESNILISINELYQNNKDTIYNNLKTKIKTDNDQSILKYYSDLPINSFLDLGLTSPFTDEELNIYKMILGELLNVLKENHIDWKINNSEKGNAL
jgi:hypothetical protein